MDCPACGLANTSEASTSVCGHQFEAEKFPEEPDWHINLAWRQKVAAYWSISWPALAGWLALISFLTDRNSVGTVVNHVAEIALAGNLAFLAIQALLTRRIVGKNYRSIRVYVIRQDGQRSRSLSFSEATRVWLWILMLRAQCRAGNSRFVEWSEDFKRDYQLDVPALVFLDWTLCDWSRPASKVLGISAAGLRIPIHLSAERSSPPP